MQCNLREFVALHYERHPESVRVFPWLRAAGGVAGSAGSAGVRGRPGASGGVFQLGGFLSGRMRFNLPQKP